VRGYSVRIPILVVVFTVLGLAAPNAESQSSGQNSSIWNKIKNAANQPNSKAPGQPQPQPPAKNSAPAQAQSSAAINETGPFTPPPGTKIDEALMAPVEQGSGFAVSPHGVHVATLSHSGSRPVMIYDGVPGPKFDQIFTQGQALTGMAGVIFSPDGNRWAYCGAQGNEWVVMVDGKELARGPGPANGQMGVGYCMMLGFSPNSKHVYYLQVGDLSNVSSPSRFVWDGKPSPYGADTDLRGYAFSPDGDHVAYIWNDPTPRSQHSQLVIDQQPAPYLAGSMQWSADSQHLFTKRVGVRDPGSRNGSVQEVLLDGKPIMRADNVTLYIPPVGNMVVAKVQKVGTPNTTFLVVNGRPVPGSETIGSISDVIFSPDGKHFGAIYSNGGRQVAFIDGKKGLDYTRVDSVNTNGIGKLIVFTSDSAHSAYLGFNANANGQFLVYDGNEALQMINGIDTELSPVGGHMATVGSGQITLDGKALNLPDVPNPRAAQSSSLSFSPDGNHFAFVMMQRGNPSFYVDGVQQPNYTPTGSTGNVNTRPYVWSPDGKHIAYFCRPSNPAAGDDVYLCLDNKAVRIGAPAAYANLLFTGDSNHLVWSRGMGQSIYRIFVDGKAVAEGYAPSVGFAKETWQIGPDGNLLVLLQDQTKMKRLSITPSPSMNLATLFGGQTTIASGK